MSNHIALLAVDPEVHAAAEAWFVRLLEPDCPAAEREAFERWRRARSAHADAYRQVQRLWEQGGEAVHDTAVMAAAQRALRFEEPRHSALRRWLAPAAALAAVVAVAVFLAPRWLGLGEPPVGIQYTTGVGEVRDITLADGSTVKLDTASILVERYSDGERRIDLLQGQAQFQVQGHPERPFVVHVNESTVTALGTEFQVRALDERTVVTLLEGRLAIATRPTGAAPRTAGLEAGQQLSFERRSGRIDPPQAFDVRTALGWTQGRLVVHEWRLRDLVDEMNRYAPVQLRLEAPELGDLRVSGTFRTGDQDTLARVLAQGWSIQFRRGAEGEILLGR